jgi:hypothetical protein
VIVYVTGNDIAAREVNCIDRTSLHKVSHPTSERKACLRCGRPSSRMKKIAALKRHSEAQIIKLTLPTLWG